MITVRTENVPAESASVNTLTTLAAVTVRLDILTLQMRNPRLARTECNWFATATRTKHRKLGGLNNRGVCLTALKARSLRSRCLQAWFPLRSVEGESPSFWWCAGRAIALVEASPQLCLHVHRGFYLRVCLCT